MSPNEDPGRRRVSIWKLLVPDFKLIFSLWLPLFAVAVWYGFYRGYLDMGLFALAMAVSVWSVCDAAVLTCRRIQDWHNQRRLAESALPPDTSTDERPFGKG